jgi:hypothetical protein
MYKLSVFSLIIALAFSFLPAQTTPVSAASPNVVISQVYGGGGNANAVYTNDFIELFNRGAEPVSLEGWSLQYASATGTGLFGSSTTAITPLSGTIAAGQYLLVQEAAGTTPAAALPTPDITDSTAINMSGTGGKVALVNTTTPLGCNGSTASPCSAAALATVVDLLGWDGANFYEGAAAPATANATASIRTNPCTDTDNNAADFATGTPTPRNSATELHVCAGPTDPTGTGKADPNMLLPGDSVLLTVAVIPGANPTSSGLSVTADLSAIGGPASQAFFDDGTNGDVTTADNTFSFATVVEGSTAASAKSLPFTVTDAQGRSSGDSIDLTVTVLLPIGTVNGPVLDTDDGAAHTSPYAGQVVTVQGVIFEKTLQATTTATTYKGFYLQNTAATADGDANTSDGLFVYMNRYETLNGPGGATYTPTVGDEVILAGTISEYYNMTELTNAFLLKPVLQSGVDIETAVPPFVANPPTALADANRYWERLQGMRGQVPVDSVVLNGRNVFSPADAEVWVARADSTIEQRADAYARRAFRDAHLLDDNYDPNSWDGNGYRILMGSLGIKGTAGDAQALIAPARTFDQLTNTPAGGVNYSFSKYRIEVTTQPELSHGVDPALNNPPDVFDPSIHYSIVDYNLENLYDFRDNPFSGCDFAGNSGCPKVAPFLSAVNPTFDYVPTSDAVYQARLGDIASQIVNDLHNPDILMLQEIENQDICTITAGALTCGTTDNADGKPDVLQELALRVASIGGPAYDAAFDRNSSDLRGIAPAYLYRTDRVELLPAAGDPVLGADPAINYPGASVPANADVSNPKTLNAVLPSGITGCETSWVFPRAPDVALFRVYSQSIGAGSHRDVYLIDNHFKSGPDGCVPHRTEQAKYNAALVQFIQAANPGARIVVGGDLNVYPRPDDPFAPIGQAGSSDQLGSLYDAGLTNLWDILVGEKPEAAYSYVYLGMAQTLDQMFINPAMLTDLQQFRIAHINSDFAAEYPDDVARGTSDHDPNVATFTINDPPTIDAGGPYTVDEGSSITLTATGADPENHPLTFAWDLNNDGTFETPGQSVSFAGVDGPAVLTVKVQATDDTGLSSVAETTVTVNNLPPTVNAPSLSAEPSIEGRGVTASASFSDPGVNDAPFTCTVDYGDGSGALAGSVVGQTCSGPAHAYTTYGAYTVIVSVTDKDGGTGAQSTSHAVIFKWTGTFPLFTSYPILNLYNSGYTVPVLFSLNGNKGLDIFLDATPVSQPVSCKNGAPLGDPVPTVTLGSTSLIYLPRLDQYTYLWKTDKAWKGTCRLFTISLVDGTTHSAGFRFIK